jgi:uncharacterized protein DUF5666
MTQNLKIFGTAISLLSIPVVLALPQSRLVSDVSLKQEGAHEQRPQGDERRIPLFGKIAAVHENTLEITNPNGEPVTVKLTPKTEFRKDREPAKRSDFKVGDIIIVRGEENADHSWTAQVVAARSMNGGGNGPGMPERAGTLGKDYVVGEVKSIDAPKISVLRSDNVAQTMELNEDTSLRRGRDSITMADIQPGDHVFARGAVQNDVFVPKFVMVMDAEQWKRMQEMGLLRARPFTPQDNNSQPPKASEPPR